MQKVELEAAWIAADLLDCKQESKMHLLSVHERVLNFQVDSWPHLLMITDPSLEKGPATIGLAEKDFRILRDNVCRKQPGWFDFADIDVNGLSCRFQIKWRMGETISFAPFKIPILDPLKMQESACSYRRILEQLTPPTPSAVLLDLPGGETYFRQSIQQFFPPLVKALITGSRTDFINCCGRIIGMGRGASPTGDDLIHGAMAAFNYFILDRQFTENLAEEMTKMVAGTTLMGKHMLETGRRGLTSEALRLFMQTLARGKVEPQVLARVLKTGSQTGFDLAVAILYFVGVTVGTGQFCHMIS